MNGHSTTISSPRDCASASAPAASALPTPRPFTDESTSVWTKTIRSSPSRSYSEIPTTRPSRVASYRRSEGLSATLTESAFIATSCGGTRNPTRRARDRALTPDRDAATIERCVPNARAVLCQHHAARRSASNRTDARAADARAAGGGLHVRAEVGWLPMPRVHRSRRRRPAEPARPAARALLSGTRRGLSDPDRRQPEFHLRRRDHSRDAGYVRLRHVDDAPPPRGHAGRATQGRIAGRVRRVRSPCRG